MWCRQRVERGIDVKSRVDEKKLCATKGRPGFDEPDRSRRKGQIYSAREVLETTNRYNENNGVSKRVHELAFGIIICFGHCWPGLVVSGTLSLARRAAPGPASLTTRL